MLMAFGWWTMETWQGRRSVPFHRVNAVYMASKNSVRAVKRLNRLSLHAMATDEKKHVESNTSPINSNVAVAPCASSSSSTEKPTDSHLVVRRLQKSDYDKGYLSILSQLTDVGDISRAEFEARLDEQQATRNTYYPMVIEDISKGRIVAAATLVIERKFIHGCALSGHIEDVVVDGTYRGLKLGARICNELLDIGKRVGCYKVILDCGRKNVPFYERLGFKEKEVLMAYYFDK